jgi:hypothetical protein
MWGLFFRSKTQSTRRVTETILASAVAMRTSASTCIRSKAPRFRTIIRIHVSRNQKGAGGDHTTSGLRKPSIFPVANRLTAVAVSSKPRSLRLRFQRCAFRDDTLLDKAPKGDCQLTCESNNAHLAATHPLPAKPLMPPKRQLAVWLVAEPKPCQLDERLPRELGTCFADPSISAFFPARVGTRCEPDNTCRRVANVRW